MKWTLFLSFFFSSQLIAQNRINTGINDTFHLEDFSFYLDGSCFSKKVEWNLEEKNALLSQVTIKGNLAYNWLTGRPPFLFKMNFSLQAILDDSLELLSANQLADKLLTSEKDSLLKEAQSTGDFKLLANNLDTETLGDKKFYVFEFAVKKKGQFFGNAKEGVPFALAGWLYYYIPKPIGNQYFISCMYWEAMPKDWYTKGYKPKYLDCFKGSLKTLYVKE